MEREIPDCIDKCHLLMQISQLYGMGGTFKPHPPNLIQHNEKYQSCNFLVGNSSQ